MVNRQMRNNIWCIRTYSVALVAGVVTRRGGGRFHHMCSAV
jgi:hypothetical protein